MIEARQAEKIFVQEARVRRPGALRRALMALFLVASVGMVVAAAFLILRARNPGYVLKRYEYAVVTRKDISNLAQFPGIIDFSSTTTLTAPAASSVSSVSVEPGALVKKGQVLVRLVSSELEQALRADADLLLRRKHDRERIILERADQEASNERDVALAQARSRRAEDAAAASRAIFERGFASKAELSAAEVTRDEAAAALADAQDRAASSGPAHAIVLSNADLDIAQAEEQLARDRALAAALSVTSPFDGKVVQVMAAAGAMLDAHAPLLTVVDQSRPIVRFEVPERQVGLLAVGQSLSIIVAGTRHPGSIATIAARATGGSETTTSSVAVTAAFQDAPGALLPGASASAELILGSRTGALTLPRGPYLTTGGDASLFVIDGNRAVKVPIAYGLQNATEVEVSRGVTEGQVVIVSSYEELMEKDSVQIDPAGGKEE